ncbi:MULTISPECIES: hypothetical protein [unclassified Roseitalea]|uniref:hypothetical protein n=1 Tax=unclassified Roseitalea TaxID=2639107 RepID=UPI00273D3880|nr:MULTISPECIES: hypothetical protein [unclassified Roseitalea]
MKPPKGEAKFQIGDGLDRATGVDPVTEQADAGFAARAFRATLPDDTVRAGRPGREPEESR